MEENMAEFYFPFPITETEDGVLLYYHVIDQSLVNQKFNKIKYQFMTYHDMLFCVFNDIWAVPMAIFEKIDLKTQRTLYFIRYGLDNLFSEVFFTFEIDEEFLVNYKAYKTFLEFKKTLEFERSKEQEEKQEENEEENEEEKNNKKNKEEKTEVLLN
jgi:hypothetical protein